MAAQILLVDDNEVVRGRLTEALNAHGGWEVCAAVENGEQALVKARELNPDLIILDLAMPVMDGLRATREILRILPSVPIVIYTLHYAEWLVLEAQESRRPRTGAEIGHRKIDGCFGRFVTGKIAGRVCSCRSRIYGGARGGESCRCPRTACDRLARHSRSIQT